MAAIKNSLSSVDDKYMEQSQLWVIVHAAINGKYAVIQEVTCLPKPQYKTYHVHGGMNKDQINHANMCNAANAERVNAYWSRGRFLNATARTFESLGGMVWSKDPESELSAKLEFLNDNADGSGSTLREVAQKTIDNLIAVGRYGILVDMPTNDKNLTLAEMEDVKNAPRWIQFTAEQITYFRVSGDSNGLDEVRLKEVHSKQKNEFEWENHCYTRRLVMINGVYHNQLYNEKEELLTDVTPIANGSVMNFIPFQFFGSDDNSPEYSKVPLYDLADANLGHFVLDCDNRDNLHFHGQGMTNAFVQDPESLNDTNPNGLNVGAKGINVFGKDDKVELLQLEATGAIPSEMLRDEQRMVMSGAQLITDNSQNETATAKRIDANASMSTLKRIVYNANSGISQLIEWTALLLADTQESTYKINTDFITDDLTPEMITKHIELVQGGILPKATLYETARKANFTKLENEAIEELALQDSQEITGTDEQTAVLQAEIDSLKEKLANG